MSQCSSWLVLVVVTRVGIGGIFNFLKASFVDCMVDWLRYFLTLLQLLKCLADFATNDLIGLLLGPRLRSANVRRPDGARLVPVARLGHTRFFLDESCTRVELSHLNALSSTLGGCKRGPLPFLQRALFLLLFSLL